jgi:putative ABC transport system permease protein
VREAWRSIARRRGRSALTVLGIALATALVVLLLALSAGIETSSSRLALASGVDLLATSANTSLNSSSFPPVSGAHRLPSEFSFADPNVATASPWLVSELVFANGSLYAASNQSANGSAVPGGWGPTGAGVVGWIPRYNSGIETPSITAGVGFPTPDDLHYANGSYTGPASHAVVLDQALAGVLHVSVGDLVWVDRSTPAGPSSLKGWFANATAFRITGLSQPFWLIPSALLGFFYLSELQGLVGGNSSSTDYASLVLVHLGSSASPERDQATLARAFPALTVFTLGNVLGQLEKVIDLYRTFGAIIGVLGLIVATLFTSTVLLMSVDDRSREIAVRRALGFSRASVGGAVLAEALVFGGLGLSAGLPAGATAAYLVSQFLTGLLPGLPQGFSFISFDASVLLSGFGEVLLISVAAAVLPAIRAMRLPIASELRAP